MRLPLITIFITNHNYGKFLKKSITSALKQSYKNFEIIIIDDCSKDDSAKILKNFEKFKNIRIFFNKKKLGLVGSSIKAIKYSKGKFFLRLDADDYLHQEAINELYQTLIIKKNTSLVFCDYFFVNKNSKLLSRFKYKHKNDYSFSDMPPHGACILIRKQSYFKVGGYNKNFSRQDGYFIWYLFYSRSVHFF